ncbi:MAG: acetylglutamate kinase [Acidobacteriaceae bacterium]|nr:acetylglutamate kinase [Acidobacteriaceae bacterium]
MKVLIKVGGTLLDEPESRARIARQLAEIAREYELVVVHGGGRQMTRYLEERGIQSRFVDGLRVSDEPVIDAILKVIAGSVNKQLVLAITSAGESAVGISGVDGLLTRAVQLDPALHAVGRPEKTEGRLLNLLVNAGHIPVIACIAGDAQGNVYNVNADQKAVSCALGWRADKLLFLTDVSGVKNQHGEVVPRLSPAEAHELIESGIATAGMRAKLDAALIALDSGLQEVLIASGQEPAVCTRLLAGDELGTRLSLQAQGVAR